MLAGLIRSRFVNQRLHAVNQVARTKIRVAAAKSPRTGSPKGHRNQMAIEHQTPINKMAIASRANQSSE